MNYGKSGNPKAMKSTPRPKRMTTKGAPKGAGDDKAALLARMKAAAAAKADGPKDGGPS